MTSNQDAAQRAAMPDVLRLDETYKGTYAEAISAADDVGQQHGIDDTVWTTSFETLADRVHGLIAEAREAGIREALEVLDAFATRAIDAGLDYQGQIALEQAEQRIRALLEGDR